MTPARQLLLALVLGTLIGVTVSARNLGGVAEPREFPGVAIHTPPAPVFVPDLREARIMGRVYDAMVRDKERAETWAIRRLLGDPWLEVR